MVGSDKLAVDALAALQHASLRYRRILAYIRYERSTTNMLLSQYTRELIISCGLVSMPLVATYRPEILAV